jgi:hypothetical protein
MQVRIFSSINNKQTRQFSKTTQEGEAYSNSMISLLHYSYEVLNFVFEAHTGYHCALKIKNLRCAMVTNKGCKLLCKSSINRSIKSRN